jgi:putative protein-disulfide isomerase
MRLIYVGDPMCSWCYGFDKELAALMERVPDLGLEIIVGGVRAGATEVLDEIGKQFRLRHWARVEAASGMPFNREAFVAREGFIYDTEPICRAVVAARRLMGPYGLLWTFRALQHAFYVDGLDTTDGRVLAEVAATTMRQMGVPIDAARFFDTWADAETIQETRRDFQRARTLGVSSFPALLLGEAGHVHLVSPGFANVDELEFRLSRLEAMLP